MTCLDIYNGFSVSTCVPPNDYGIIAYSQMLDNEIGPNIPLLKSRWEA
jgi:hypothetical protein